MSEVKMSLKDEYEVIEFTVKMTDEDNPYDSDIEQLYHIFKRFLGAAGYCNENIKNICYVTKEEDVEIKAKAGFSVRDY